MAGNGLAVPNDGNILMEGAQLVFKNFAGVEGMFNREGDRNFCVLLDDELAKQLEDDNWNVKSLKVREEGDTPQKYLQVSIKYRGKEGTKVRPPRIVMITSRGRNEIPEDLLDMLDYAEIANADLMIRPYAWTVRENTGVKAYLKSLYVTIAEDALERKYADVPEIGASDQLQLEAGGDPNIIEGEGEWVEDDPKELER